MCQLKVLILYDVVVKGYLDYCRTLCLGTVGITLDTRRTVREYRFLTREVSISITRRGGSLKELYNYGYIIIRNCLLELTITNPLILDPFRVVRGKVPKS